MAEISRSRTPLPESSLLFSSDNLVFVSTYTHLIPPAIGDTTIYLDHPGPYTLRSSPIQTL